MTKAEIIGRVISYTDPERADEIVKKYRKMLKKPKYVEKIYEEVYEMYSEETMEDKRQIFIATIYQIYQPLSYLENKEDGKAAGKLPPGIRDEMARCLGFVNPEMCNHYKTFTEAPMKPESNGVVRPFKVKVMDVVERFKPYSIHADDTQYKLI